MIACKFRFSHPSFQIFPLDRYATSEIYTMVFLPIDPLHPGAAYCQPSTTVQYGPTKSSIPKEDSAHAEAASKRLQDLIPNA